MKKPAITTDASGSWGCGGFWQSHWFQQPWESQEVLTSQCIVTKGMLPIPLSCAIWGKHWHGNTYNSNQIMKLE